MHCSDSALQRLPIPEPTIVAPAHVFALASDALLSQLCASSPAPLEPCSHDALRYMHSALSTMTPKLNQLSACGKRCSMTQHHNPDPPDVHDTCGTYPLGCISKRGPISI